jgi:hypothetical protein
MTAAALLVAAVLGYTYIVTVVLPRKADETLAEDTDLDVWLSIVRSS